MKLVQACLGWPAISETQCDFRNVLFLMRVIECWDYNSKDVQSMTQNQLGPSEFWCDSDDIFRPHFGLLHAGDQSASDRSYGWRKTSVSRNGILQGHGDRKRFDRENLSFRQRVKLSLLITDAVADSGLPVEPHDWLTGAMWTLLKERKRRRENELYLSTILRQNFQNCNFITNFQLSVNQWVHQSWIVSIINTASSTIDSG